MSRRDFTSDLTQLAEIRQFVRACCEAAWPRETSAEVFIELDLAVQEAAANVIHHAYGNTAGQPIHLDVSALPDEVEVILTHHGADFDPVGVPSPRFDGSRTGGFGVHLIRELMDEVEYLHGEQPGIRFKKRRALRQKET